MIERRRYHDTQGPRCTYAPAANAVINCCKLVQRYSYAHAALLAQDFDELVAEADFVLLRAPPGFVVAQEFDICEVREALS